MQDSLNSWRTIHEVISSSETEPDSQLHSHISSESPKFWFEKPVDVSESTTVSDAAVHAPIPLEKQFDKRFESERAKEKRSMLRHHVLVREALKKFWLTFPDHQRQHGVCRDEYVKVHVRMNKALRVDFSLNDAMKLAQNEYLRDVQRSHIAPAFDEEAFCDAIFEIADIWTPSTNASVYIEFLNTLLLRIAKLSKTHFYTSSRAALLDAAERGRMEWRDLEDIPQPPIRFPKVTTASFSNLGTSTAGRKTSVRRDTSFYNMRSKTRVGRQRMAPEVQGWLNAINADARALRRRKQFKGFPDIRTKIPARPIPTMPLATASSRPKRKDTEVPTTGSPVRIPLVTPKRRHNP